MWTRRRLLAAALLTTALSGAAALLTAEGSDARGVDPPAPLLRHVQEPPLAAEAVAAPATTPGPVAPSAEALLAVSRVHAQIQRAALRSLRFPLPPPPDPLYLPLGELSAAADALVAARPGQVSVVVHDLDAQRRYVYEPRTVHVLASLTKVPIALAALDHQLTAGPYEPDVQYWLRQMIVNSDNLGTLIMLQQMGGEEAYLRYINALGFPELARFYFEPDWGESGGRADDVSRLFQTIAVDDSVPSVVRTQLYRLLGSVAPDQRWGLSAGLGRHLPGWSVLLKNGWYPVESGWRVHSAGIVRDDAQLPRYVIVVLMSGQPSFEDGVAAVERLAWAIYRAIAAQRAETPDGEGGGGALTAAAAG